MLDALLTPVRRNGSADEHIKTFTYKSVFGLNMIVLRILILVPFVLTSLSIQAHEVLTDDDFPPYSYVDKSGNIVGIDVDIVRELATRTDLPLQLKLAPFKRILLSLKEGKSFGGLSLFRTTEREQYGLFTHPIHYSTFRIITRHDSPLNFKTVQDLSGIRVGVQAGFVISDDFDLAAKEGRIERIDLFSYADSFNRLSKGGIEAFVGNDAVVKFKLLNEPQERLRLDQVRFSEASLTEKRGAYLVLSKKWQGDDVLAWQKTITETLQAMEKEGFYEQVQQRYLGAQ
jgi:polar amino acid transport system substrate-binding protein